MYVFIVQWTFRYWNFHYWIGNSNSCILAKAKKRSRALQVHNFFYSWYKFFLLFSVSLLLNCELVIGAVTRAFWQMSHHLTESEKEVTYFSWVKGFKNSCPHLSRKFLVWCSVEKSINWQYMHKQCTNKYEQKIFLIILFLIQLSYTKGFFHVTGAKLNALDW